MLGKVAGYSLINIKILRYLTVRSIQQLNNALTYFIQIIMNMVVVQDIY